MGSWQRICVFSLGLAVQNMPAWGSGDPTVVTLPGPAGAELHGVYNSDRDLFEWRGIRFAQPPLGALRWKPPQPITLTGSVDASEFGRPCTQPGWPVSGEDCLFLN